MTALVKAARGSVTEFAGAEKALETQKRDASKGPTPKKKGRPVKQAVGANEHAPTVFKAMTTSLDIEAALPCLFSNSVIANKMRKSTHIVAIESAEKFAPAFAKSELRNTVGRACHTLYDESSWERCFDMMASLIPNMLVNTFGGNHDDEGQPFADGLHS